MFPERINISPLPPTQGYPTVLLEPGSQAQLLISCPSAPSTSKGNSPASNSLTPNPTGPIDAAFGTGPAHTMLGSSSLPPLVQGIQSSLCSWPRPPSRARLIFLTLQRRQQSPSLHMAS